MLDLTGSVASLGLVVGARSLANVVLLLFGGVVADRLPRPLVLQGSSYAAAITQGVVAASVLAGFATVPLLVVLSALNGAVAAVSMPASQALTPQTVPVGELRPANALRTHADQRRAWSAARRSAARSSRRSDLGGGSPSTR